MDKNVAFIENIIFLNKQNIAWNQVEQYLKSYIGNSYTVAESRYKQTLGRKQR